MSLGGCAAVAPSAQATLNVVTTQTNIPLYPSGRLVRGPDGSLWLPGLAGSAVLRFSSHTGKLIGSRPVNTRIDGDAAFGSDGRLWYRSGYDNYVYRLNPDGSADSLVLPSLTTTRAQAAGFAATSGGVTWVSAVTTVPQDPRTSEIIKYARDGAVSVYPLPGMFWPDELIAATDGALWASAYQVTNNDGGPIVHILPNGLAESYGPGYAAKSLTPTSSGGLLAAQTVVGQVALRFTPHGDVKAFSGLPVPSPVGKSEIIGSVVASDGHDGIWYGGPVANGDGAVFGHISAAGAVDYQARSDFNPSTGTSGPDGSFFFVGLNTTKGVRLVHVSIVAGPTKPKRCGTVVLKGKYAGRRAAVEVARGDFTCVTAQQVATKAASKPFVTGATVPAPAGWKCKAIRPPADRAKRRYVLGCWRTDSNGAVQIGVRYPAA